MRLNVTDLSYEEASDYFSCPKVGSNLEIKPMSIYNNKHRRLAKVFIAIFLLSMLSIAAFGYMAKDRLFQIAKNWRDRPVETSIYAKGGIVEPYLTVDWPDNPYSKEQPAITFRIPREYVHQGTTFRGEKSIESISIMFELPKTTPWQDRPWLEAKKGEPEYAEFKKVWFGKFTLDISRFDAFSYETRMWKRSQLQPDSEFDERPASTSTTSFRLADWMGLERYTNITCYSLEARRTMLGINDFLKAKTKEDPSPDQCSINSIQYTTLLSPPDITNEDEAIVVECMGVDCYTYFSVNGRGVRMDISYENLPRWKEFTEPARKLVRSFIVENMPPLRATSKSYN